MSGMVTVARVELRLLTPTFVAGADQNRPELRATAIKSALRFWYRAVDPHAVLAESEGKLRKEDRFFGGSDKGAGRSPVLLDVIYDPSNASEEFQWNGILKSRIGLKYLVYSLQMEPNVQRKGLPPDFRATLVMRAENKSLELLGEEGRRAWIAALWLFGNLGSLGTRSRRGLGSVEITNWPPFQVREWAEAAAALPSLAAAETFERWRGQFEQGMKVLDSWYPFFTDERFGRARWLHPHLGREFEVRTMSAAPGWEEALDRAGRKLQEFRLDQRRADSELKAAFRQGRTLPSASKRAVFGLPLTFHHYSGREVEFVPTRREPRAGARHASLLRLRVVELGKSVCPVFVRLAGPMPGIEPPSDAIMRNKQGQQEDRQELQPVESDLLDKFMKSLGGGA